MTEINKEIEEMAENILTCPFCGGEPLMETFSVRKGYEANIHCDKCLASISTITYDTEGEAILNCLKNWNSRIGYRKEKEVVKEFAEKLKIKLADKSGWVTYKCQDLCWDIDKIAKEYGVEVE